jgi:hypothetical protein
MGFYAKHKEIYIDFVLGLFGQVRDEEKAKKLPAGQYLCPLGQSPGRSLSGFGTTSSSNR